MPGLLNVGRQAGAMNRPGLEPDESIFANRPRPGGGTMPAGPGGRGFGRPGRDDMEVTGGPETAPMPTVGLEEPDAMRPAPQELEAQPTQAIAEKRNAPGLLKGKEPAEQPDFSDRYNTKLSPEDEAKFQDAAKKNPKLLHDTFDYDTRGDWKATGNKVDERGHGGDTFKKPNHPTFSDQSVYHGVDGHQGGKWSQQGDGKWNYEASPTNIQMHGKEGLQDYFGKYERGNAVTFPQEAPGQQNMTPEQAAQSGASAFR